MTGLEASTIHHLCEIVIALSMPSQTRRELSDLTVNHHAASTAERPKSVSSKTNTTTTEQSLPTCKLTISLTMMLRGIVGIT